MLKCPGSKIFKASNAGMKLGQTDSPVVALNPLNWIKVLVSPDRKDIFITEKSGGKMAPTRNMLKKGLTWSHPVVIEMVPL